MQPSKKSFRSLRGPRPSHVDLGVQYVSGTCDVRGEDPIRPNSSNICVVSRDSITVPGASFSARGGMPKASSAREKLVDWLFLPLFLFILCISVFVVCIYRRLRGRRGPIDKVINSER